MTQSARVRAPLALLFACARALLPLYAAAGALLLVATTASAAERADEHPGNPALTHVDPKYMVSRDEVLEWHAAKDVLGPAFSGSPSWRVFLEVIETKLRRMGAVDIERYAWTYDRWHTSEWPDVSHWSLRLGNQPVRVASYGASSGTTPEDGLTAPLVFYDPEHPPASIEGKIVVFALEPETEDTPAERRIYVRPEDYLYLSAADTFPDPDDPRAVNLSVHLRSEMRQASGWIDTLVQGKALGAVMAFQSSYERLAGLYTFGVPPLHQVPTLYVDREAGAQVLAAARAGQSATLRLVATVEPTETYQLLAYLPGRDYGTDRDEQIYLVTHTDGPSISQDDGGYGILALASYFSHIPQAERPRTLMLFFDNRHFMPGAERTFREQDWRLGHPEMWDKIVATIGIEHLGQLEYIEKDGVFQQTGLVEHSRLHASNNDQLIAMAIQAVKDNGLERVSVQCVDRPGVHGLSQGRWFGLGAVGRRRGLPAYATMGDMGAYWSTAARMQAFDADHFLHQVATMAQLAGNLMVADMARLQPKPAKD